MTERLDLFRAAALQGLLSMAARESIAPPGSEEAARVADNYARALERRADADRPAEGGAPRIQEEMRELRRENERLRGQRAQLRGMAGQCHPGSERGRALRDALAVFQQRPPETRHPHTAGSGP